MGTRPEDLDASLERIEGLRRRYEMIRRRLRRNDGADDLLRLDSSIARRRARLDHLESRIEALEAERRQLRDEVIGCLRGAEALLSDLVDRLDALEGPCWSPTPVVGYSLFDVHDGAIDDGDHTWNEPILAARCPAGHEEPPHDRAPCRIQPCGVLVWKSIDSLVDVSGAELGAVAEVALSGRVIEHELGYRGARGQITGLVAFDADRWFRSRNARHIARFVASPHQAFDELAAPIPPDGMLILELDLFFGA